MSLIVALDAGPLGMITNRRSSPQNERCKDWLAALVQMLKAAQFWASARKVGRKSAPDASLDADMILAAQVALLPQQGDQAIIATTNVRHLGMFAAARNWEEIS